MYCKHCGREIADDSTFCQHCGKQIVIDKDIITSKIPCDSSLFAYWKTMDKKKYLLLYVIWVVLNVFFFCFHQSVIVRDIRPITSLDGFFPFTNGRYTYMFDVRFYDITEFAIYVFLIPLLVTITIKKKYLLLYGIWFVINVIFLCSGQSKINGMKIPSRYYFFPFSQERELNLFMFDVRIYDITEFIFYAIFIPLVIFYVFKYLHYTKRDKTPSSSET